MQHSTSREIEDAPQNGRYPACTYSTCTYYIYVQYMHILYVQYMHILYVQYMHILHICTVHAHVQFGIEDTHTNAPGIIECVYPLMQGQRLYKVLLQYACFGLGSWYDVSLNSSMLSLNCAYLNFKSGCSAQPIRHQNIVTNLWKRHVIAINIHHIKE